MFRFIRSTFPTIHLHALSAPEVYFLQKITKWPMRDVIARLRDAGLQSIPGGGAEILEDSVRKRIWSLTKAPTEKWVDVHESAHALGMRTTATMMFGVGETYAQRVEHLQVVRDLQDRTGGFTAWIPWTFQKENTELDGKVDEAGGFEYLKTLAVSRLFFDNIRHVQGSWVTQGPKIGQVSLSFGADDLGSIMIEENVVYAAGARNRMTQDEMRRIIADAGYTPVQRRTLYDACPDACCAAPIPAPRTARRRLCRSSPAATSTPAGFRLGLAEPTPAGVLAALACRSCCQHEPAQKPTTRRKMPSSVRSITRVRRCFQGGSERKRTRDAAPIVTSAWWARRSMTRSRADW